MRCNACNNWIPKGSKYCQTCGRRIKNKRTDERKQLILGIICFALVLLNSNPYLTLICAIIGGLCICPIAVSMLKLATSKKTFWETQGG